MKHSFLLVAWSLAALRLSAAEVDFAHEIVPVLKQHCGRCHTGDQQLGGLSLNSRQSLLAGGESGPSVVVGRSGQSELVARLAAEDESLRMPPEGPRVPPEQVALVQRWIDEGLRWEEGFSFGQQTYEPPLEPRRVELPPAVDDREHPLDRLLDAYLAQRHLPRPRPIDDATFLRRVYLDILGLLPTPEQLEAFLADGGSDKRASLVRTLLERDVDYAEHWLTFWNDLLRNDYTGTGFITGGRSQISKWLYAALVTNMPYDQFARELIAPPMPESAGYGQGIRWRGDVSAGQTVEIQFAQSVGQTFLGINLKCASCHDSFIDRWKLEDAYGLAAIFSTRPLEIHRCDKPIGKTAGAAWLFPELGQVDPQAPQPERLKQLAALMTHPENGRFTRTIVNRIWHRLMGHGIVHPTDAMQTEPWSADLLDYLAVHLADHAYDLKQTLELIATSQAYQSQAQVVGKDSDDHGYVYAGPRAKRLTAEQFVDCLWQLTGTAPSRFDAPVVRGRPAAEGTPAQPLQGKWIWSRAETCDSPPGETVVFRRQWNLQTVPTQAVAAISCDNRYVLSVNGQRVHTGDNWEMPDAVLLTPKLKAGRNQIVIVASNGGAAPNPAGLFFETRLLHADGTGQTIASDETWQWTMARPDQRGRFPTEPDDWQAAVPVARPEVWASRLSSQLAAILTQGTGTAGRMVRASLVKSDFLMRSLGRPNRDQIVSVRPNELTTLEAIDLSNGQILADMLERGAVNLRAQSWDSPQDLVRWLYRHALSRDPQPDELDALTGVLGDTLTEQGIQDVLWAVVMLPEFQFVR